MHGTSNNNHNNHICDDDDDDYEDNSYIRLSRRVEEKENFINNNKLLE